MPFGGLLSIGVGTAMGAGKYAAAKNRADKDRKLSAEQIRLSPYTGRTEFQQVKEPSLFEALAGGAGAGINAGQTFGAFKSPTPEVDVTGSTTGGYGNANLGVDTTMQQPTMPMTSLAATRPGVGVGGSPFTNQYMMTNLQRQKARRDENMFG